MKIIGEKRSDASVSGGSSFQDFDHTPESLPLTTCQMHSTSNASADSLSIAERSYFQERLRNRLYDVIITLFMQREADGFTKAELARILAKKPEQISRLLANPGNWTLDTVSDLLLGICKAELELEVSYPFDKKNSDEKRPTWLRERGTQIQKQLYMSHYVDHKYFVVNTVLNDYLTKSSSLASLNGMIAESKNG